MRRCKLPLGFLCTALIAVGCGSDPDQPSEPSEPSGEERTAPVRLSPRERQMVFAFDKRIQAHCVRVARTLTDPASAPSPREARNAFAAADGLIALAARKPTAPLGAGQDVRLFLSDVVENLEGFNCDPRMISRLERGLASVDAS